MITNLLEYTEETKEETYEVNEKTLKLFSTFEEINEKKMKKRKCMVDRLNKCDINRFAFVLESHDSNVLKKVPLYKSTELKLYRRYLGYERLYKAMKEKNIQKPYCNFKDNKPVINFNITLKDLLVIKRDEMML